MSSLPSIHWHEGLFLQPHHLQYQQHQLSRELASWRELSLPFPYGLVHSEVSRDALEKMLVRIDRLRLVTRAGLVLDVPGNTDIPALDIKRAYEATSEPLVIRIGVPLRYDARANVIESAAADDWREKRLYRVREVESADENSGQNEQRLRVRRINARLLLPDDDDSDLETLPLLRIVHDTGTGDGKPGEDGAFLPPCMLLSGSPRLRQMVRDLAVFVQGERGETVRSLATAGFDLGALHGPQLGKMLRLRTLNRFSTALEHLAMVPSITPLHAYLQLTELLGELAALRPDRDAEAFPLPPYDHDRPGLAFTEIISKIRKVAAEKDKSTWKKLPFEERGNVRFLTMTEVDFTQGSDYFLGILCKERDDSRTLAQLVEDADRFKFMPGDWATKLQPGVRLKWEMHPPGALERPAHLHYFRLLRGDSQTMWDTMTRQKSMAIVCKAMNLNNYSFFLYMTIPE